MSNYVHPNNQMILWNTVNRIPAFLQLSPPKRDLEFKRVIENMYRLHEHKSVLSQEELNSLNRETVLAFIPQNQILKPNMNPNPNPNSNPPNNNPTTGKPPLFPRENDRVSSQTSLPPQNQTSNPFVVETREEKYHRAFQERQQAYEKMMEKPELPSLDIFKEKYEDTAISNMDELILEYQKQRNLDIAPLPPVLTNTRTQENPNLNTSVRPKKINILSDSIVNIESEVLDLELELPEKEEEQDTDINKKKVSWKSNLQDTRMMEDEYYVVWENRLKVLEETVRTLSLQNQEQEKTTTQEKNIQCSPEYEEVESILDTILSTVESNS